MNGCFVDTFAFLALLNRNDEAHQRALEAFGKTNRQLVTTRWVLMELADGLCMPGARIVAANLIAKIDHEQRMEVVSLSDELFVRGMALYRERADKEWSLTDCISFIAMEDYGIREALTADHHFEQAGFIALLKWV